VNVPDEKGTPYYQSNYHGASLCVSNGKYLSYATTVPLPPPVMLRFTTWKGGIPESLRLLICPTNISMYHVKEEDPRKETGHPLIECIEARSGGRVARLALPVYSQFKIGFVRSTNMPTVERFISGF
jgi:hypothetical protein